MAIPELDYRRATVEDADALAELERLCFSDPWNLDMFRGFLANPAVYFMIAENDGKIIAYAGIIVILDECEIMNVAVHPKLRRCGIGRIIMNKVIDICRKHGVSMVFLEHRESNTAAAALYDGFGFEAYAVRRRYYTSPVEDAVLRRLEL